MPKITIVIPAYNSLPYLPQTMGSVFSQTLTDFEIIVVNDGSIDETEKYVSQIEDPRVKLVSQSNQGLAGARNTGIDHAQGEYIAFLDDDDLWESTKLEKQLRVLEENPEVGLVYTWVAYIDEQAQFTGRTFKNCVEGHVWKELTAHNIVECGSVPMVRRSCFEACGMFDRNLGSAVEDWDMWLRIATCYSFKVVKEPLVYYRQRSTSSSKNWQAMSKSFHLVIEKAFASAPPELLYLKKQSYGFAYLCLAWKPLQSNHKNYQKADYFFQQALEYYPQLRLSKECVRLSLAIALMRLLKPDGYAKIKSLLYALQRLMPQ